MTRSITLEQATAAFTNRYTMEHKPLWANVTHMGKQYAPQYASDKEWYDNTLFYGESDIVGDDTTCYSSGETWPLGEWLTPSTDPLPEIEVDFMETPAGLAAGEFASMTHYDKLCWKAWCLDHDWCGTVSTRTDANNDMYLTVTGHYGAIKHFNDTETLLAWAGY